jgi:hypothetical protein
MSSAGEGVTDSGAGAAIGLRRHRRAGSTDEFIPNRHPGGKQACLDVFDGLGLHPLGRVP